jgi:hypothetical protein
MPSGYKVRGYRRLRMTESEKTTSEEFTVSGDKLVEKIKELIQEGNIRRVLLIHKDRTIFDIPLSIGAPAAAAIVIAAPVLAAIGAFAALVTECTLKVEKVEKS